MNKSRKAQQLVELAFVIPLIMVFAIVIIEIGYALNTRSSLAEATKISLAKMNSIYTELGTTEEKKQNVKSELSKSIKEYFKRNNIPFWESIDVDIISTSSQTSLVKVTGKYYPSFLLPNVLGGQIIPTEYTFSTSQIINDALLQQSSFSSGLTSEDLTMFYRKNISDDGKTSILRSPLIDNYDVRYRTAFLLGFESGTTYARLFNWWGQDILPPNLAINISTGHLSVKSPYYNGGNWLNTNIPYTWVLTSHGFTHAVYTKTPTNPTFKDRLLNIGGLDATYNPDKIPWCGQGGSTGSCSGDISGAAISNPIKSGFSLRPNNAITNNTYDPITNAVSGIQLYEHIVVRDNYILKMYVPTPAPITDDYKGYKFSFGIDGSGKLAAGGSGYDIVDCYLDTDGDNIPDAWDKDPQYPDADLNGVLDGNQTASITLNTAMPDEIDISVTPVTLTPDLTNATALAQYPNLALIQTPFIINKSTKTLNNNNNTGIYIPKPYYIRRFTISNGTNAGLYYFIEGFKYKRVAPTWTNELSEKSKFIYGTVSSPNIDLNTSGELQHLQNNVFDSSHKVTLE